MAWFEKLAPRERALVALAAVLLLLFILWQFLISPVLSGADKAQRQLDIAKRDHAIVSSGLPKMSQQGRTPKAELNQNSLVIVARKTNVAISRVQPGSDGSLQVWLEDSPTQNVYSFLMDLERGYNAATDKAQITRRDNGTVAAQFTFVPR